MKVVRLDDVRVRGQRQKRFARLRVAKVFATLCRVPKFSKKLNRTSDCGPGMNNVIA